MSMMLTVIFALSVVSYMGSSNIKESTDEIATNWLPSVAAAGDLENAFFSKRLDYARHVLSLSAEDIEAGDIAVSESRAMMEEAIKSYVPFVASEKERTVLAELQSAIASYDGVGEALMALSRENKNVEATQVFKGPMKLEADKVEKLIDELVALNLAGSAAAVASSDLRFDNTVTLIVSVVVFATVISILGIVYVLKRVSTPIQQITTAMRKLAEGDSTSEIPFSGRTDEIGDMAAAVEVFRQNAIKNELLEQEAAESRSATEAGQIVT
jgi:methyl-accepting chemotaxis protein